MSFFLTNTKLKSKCIFLYCLHKTKVKPTVAVTFEGMDLASSANSSWHHSMFHASVYTSNPLKCQALQWSQTKFMQKEVNTVVHFVASLCLSRLSQRYLCQSNFKWQIIIQKAQGQFLLLLIFKYTRNHLHMDLRIIYFLTNCFWEYGITGQRVECNKNAL